MFLLPKMRFETTTSGLDKEFSSVASQVVLPAAGAAGGADRGGAGDFCER